MTYAKAVDSIGRSTKLSTWIVQLIADLYGPIEVVDELESLLETKIRIFKFKGKDCNRTEPMKTPPFFVADTTDLASSSAPHTDWTPHIKTLKPSAALMHRL